MNITTLIIKTSPGSNLFAFKAEHHRPNVEQGDKLSMWVPRYLSNNVGQDAGHLAW